MPLGIKINEAFLQEKGRREDIMKLTKSMRRDSAYDSKRKMEANKPKFDLSRNVVAR